MFIRINLVFNFHVHKNVFTNSITSALIIFQACWKKAVSFHLILMLFYGCIINKVCRTSSYVASAVNQESILLVMVLGISCKKYLKSKGQVDVNISSK